MFPSDRIVGAQGPEVRVGPGPARLILDQLGPWVRNVRGLDDELSATLAALEEVATTASGAVAVPISLASAFGNDIDGSVEESSSVAVVTVAEAAELIGRTPRRVRQLISSGVLEAVRLHPILLALDEVEGYADQLQENPHDELQ